MGETAWDLGKPACFSFKGRPRKKALRCHVQQETQVKSAVKMEGTGLLGHSVDGGDPHPEPEGLLSPPSSGSQHTCPLKM